MRINFRFPVALLILIIFFLSQGNLFAQDKKPKTAYTAIDLTPFSDSRNHWYGIYDKSNIVNPAANQPKYSESEITKIADNILLYQRNNGGWPKNYDMQAILTKEQADSLVKTKDQLHTTFDNSTTHTHIDYLAQVYTQTKIEKYREACLKGIRFVLAAQYPNGGWPQYYPLEDNYSRRITFNDGAYLGIMALLGKIVSDDPNFEFIDDDIRKKVKNAYDGGLECILKSQIVSNGRLTAWCQQHSELDLQPVWARAFEPPSICNGESVPVVLFLMDLDKPDQRIIDAVQGAVKWFEKSKILYTKIETVRVPPEQSPYKTITTDKVVVTDSLAAPIWTRFYELGSERPLFSDRNSKFLYSMSEVSLERRNGYGWYTYAPREVLKKYPEWQKKWAPGEDVQNSFGRLAISANRRFLTEDGAPFFWLGDTGWLLPGRLNREETEKYLENRREKGFNVIQIMLLHNLSVVDARGDSALVNKNVATPKLAATISADGSQKNGYWENIDFIADLAAKKGIYLAMVPIWGPNVRAGHVTETQAEIYAGFLANRYRDKKNIIWVNGGDVRGDDSIRIWNTIGNTLRKLDPNHLITFHPFGRTQSSMWFHNEPWLDFNMFQSGHRSYAQDTSRADLRYGEDNWRYVQTDYSKIPVKPTLDGEPSYEGIPYGLHDTLQPKWSADELRRYAYWSVFAGACGFTYGNSSVMQMHKGGSKPGGYGARQPWYEAVNAPGAGQMIYLKNLMLNYHFEELVPDPSLLSDQGERYNHLSALKGSDFLLVYTYNGRVISLKSDKLAGEKFGVNWYSPRNGLFLNAGEIKKGEKFDFDPPGEKKDGNDWVLILIRHTGSTRSAGYLPVPRDTSFTPYLTWLKIRKEFPGAKIKSAKLPAGLTDTYNIVYKTLPVTPYGKRDLHLDLFRPEKKGKYPALILVHGGGWRSGDRSMQIPMAQQIATNGYVTAAVEYRLSPEALYPAAVEDIKAAVRYLRSNAAKYSIDPDRIAVTGSSAGGQLAALTGMTADVKKFDGEGADSKVSARIQAIIDMDGILDFRDPNESAKDNDPLRPSAGAMWFGGSYREVPEKWAEASPIVYAGRNSPPVLFINSALPRFHAGRDSVIAILNKYAIYSEVHTLPDTPHPFWLFDPWFEPTVSYMVTFLDKVLKANKN
ncbi:MAG TPA: pectate lyase [Prolixibacteraceae bacterium]|nr:pectate lyase [Prolixibacteraceae bacterium]